MASGEAVCATAQTCRGAPVWVTDEYVMPDALTRGARRPPGRADPERLDDEVKLALRKLLRTLERSAA